MSRERTPAKIFGRGVVAAAVMSGAFVGMSFLTSPPLAAVVVVPASIAIGALMARAVPRATADCLVEHAPTGTVVVAAPKAAALGTVAEESSTSAA